METHQTNRAFAITNLVFTSIGTFMCFISLLYKLCRGIALPKLWKYSICLLDNSALFFGIGLEMHLCILILNRATPKFFMLASSSLMLFGYMDGLCSFISFQTILLFVQNPRKIYSTSSYQLGTSIIVLTGIKLACLLLSILPVIPKQDQAKPSLNNLFPLYDPRQSGGTYTSLLVCCFWIIIVTTLIFSIIGVVKSRKSNNFVHDSNEEVNVPVIYQGKMLHNLLLLELCIYIIVSIMVTRLLFGQSLSDMTTSNDHNAALITVSVHLILHAVLTNLCNFAWGRNGYLGKQCGNLQESRQLKRLELLRTEHSGKHHFLASWLNSKGELQTGLMKTYSESWQKLWCQEIMVLGMLRKLRGNRNLLRCVWTSNHNPYHEIVSLLSQHTVSRESRIICMEFPEYGCLREYLKNMETPLSAASQCRIISDVGQGLLHLHQLDILHKHLSSIRVYLRANTANNSLFRAALGDFEYVSIFGSPLQGGDNPTCKNRQTFFLPDIRSFALITLEMILSVCSKLIEIQKNNHQNPADTLNSLNPMAVAQSRQRHWQSFENKTVIKGRLGFFPSASEESLHQDWNEMNPNGLNQSKFQQTQPTLKSIFVAPTRRTSSSLSELPPACSTHSSIPAVADDSIVSDLSMQAERDSDSELSLAEFNEFLSSYGNKKPEGFIPEHKIFNQRTSLGCTSNIYQRSSFPNKLDYSYVSNGQFTKGFCDANNLNKPENREDKKEMRDKGVAIPGEIINGDEEEANKMAEPNYYSEENILKKTQRKNKARMNLQKSLTSRGMSFNPSFPQNHFKKRELFNDTLQTDSPYLSSSKNTLPGRPENIKTCQDFVRNAKDDQACNRLSYQTSNSSVLESSHNSSHGYATDISCLSSATEALTRKILLDEKLLLHRHLSTEDIHRRIIDSGFETESSPSNSSNIHSNAHRLHGYDNCFNLITKDESFSPSSDDYLYLSDNNFSIHKKPCANYDQENHLATHASNKNVFIYPNIRHGINRSSSDRTSQKSPYKTCASTRSNQNELQNSNSPSKRYKELKRRGVPLKISIVSSNFNQISTCSPSLSACSEVTTPEKESKNIFFPQPMTSSSIKEKYDQRRGEDSPRKNSSSLFKQSLEGSPVFTTKVIGSPCPPTPTTIIPNSLFMSSDKAMLEPRSSCTDIPEVDENWKFAFSGNSVQNQDTMSVPSRQVSRLNSTTMSHCSSLSHLSLPGKSIQGKYKLLPGVNEHHLGYCIDLVDKQPLLSIDDLLPATKSTFKHLKDKLIATGELTNAAIQLLDIVVWCWYAELPPPTARLCEQLRDPVLETTV
ncbi:uncharacterized protein LOC115217889 [Argonauta hians]